MRSSPPPPAAPILERLPARDPDLWLAVVACVVVALCCIQILLFSFGRDHAIYAVVADGLVSGRMPYRDLWDFKPPGIFFVYGLAQVVFGNNMAAPRLIEVAGLLGVVLAFGRLGHVFFGTRVAGLLGAALAVLLHTQLDFWHTGQPEAFGGILTTYALALMTVPAFGRDRYLVWAAVGVLFGAAFLLKPPLGGGALACCAYLGRLEQDRSGVRWRALLPVLLMGLGSLLPIAACALWFWSRGAWPDLAWGLFEFAPGYTMLSWEGRSAPEMFYYALEEALFGFSALAAAGVIAAAVMTPLHSREREGLFLLLGIISVHIAGIAMQGKFFAYHYSATLMLIAFVAGLGLYKMWRRSLSGGSGGILVFGSFVAVAAIMRTASPPDLRGNFWYRSAVRFNYALGNGSIHAREVLDERLYSVTDYDLDADRRVALEVARLTEPHEPIFVWGFEPAIYWLAERSPASRFIYNVPQRASWEQERARALLMQGLKTSPPAVIVVQQGDVFPAVTGDALDSEAALYDFPALASLLKEHYDQAATIEDFTLFVRREGK